MPASTIPDTDNRQDKEHADVSSILAALPEDSEGRGHELTHPIPAEPLKPLTEAFFSGRDR